jgi:hypothetical protein
MRLKLAAAAFVAALSVTPAFAEILNFSWEYAPGEVATWSQSSNPIPIAVDPGQLSRVTVDGGTITGFMSFSVVDFDSEAGNGGLIIGNIDVESTGVQTYTGSRPRPYSPLVNTS